MLKEKKKEALWVIPCNGRNYGYRITHHQHRYCSGLLSVSPYQCDTDRKRKSGRIMMFNLGIIKVSFIPGLSVVRPWLVQFSNGRSIWYNA